MEDIVSYAVPFGVIGRMANSWIISQRIKSIFEFRKEVLDKLFVNTKNQ
jgi:hypothetical protein